MTDTSALELPLSRYRLYDYSDKMLYVGIRPFLIWVACVTFIILTLDNFLSWQPNNTRTSTPQSNNTCIELWV